MATGLPVPVGEWRAACHDVHVPGRTGALHPGSRDGLASAHAQEWI